MPMTQFATEDFKKQKLGCTQDDKRAEAFLEIVSYLEDNDDEQITINDLIDLMNQKLANTDYDGYCYTYMKTRLQEYFCERIVQTKITECNHFQNNSKSGAPGLL